MVIRRIYTNGFVEGFGAVTGEDRCQGLVGCPPGKMTMTGMRKAKQCEDGKTALTDQGDHEGGPSQYRPY